MPVSDMLFWSAFLSGFSLGIVFVVLIYSIRDALLKKLED